MGRKRQATDASQTEPAREVKRRVTRSAQSPLLSAKLSKAPVKSNGTEDNSNSLLPQGSEVTNEEPTYWLMKAEPETRIEKGKDVKFSIDDLAACDEPAGWDGVRNYGARNNLKAMKMGDLAFFYHSNCKVPGIVGIMEIVKEASIDETAFDPDEPYYDPKSDQKTPKWYLVHVEFRRKLERQISLTELKKYASAELKELPLLKQGRLSVSAVPSECWKFILELEKRVMASH